MVKYKTIDEHFFDTEGKSPDQLKRMCYIKGAWLTGARPVGENDVEFRSRQRDLVEIVLAHLNSNYTASKRGASYGFRAYSVPHLRSILESNKLAEDGKQTEFPYKEIPLGYMSDFVRGIIENLGIIYLDGGAVRLIISHNHDFLVGMNNTLRTMADVQRPEPTTNTIIYCRGDIAKVFRFIYRDLNFDEQSGLYLQSVKNTMEHHVRGFTGMHPFRVQAIRKTEDSRERIKMSKADLIKGHQVKDVAIKRGYSTVAGYIQAFKRVMAITPGEFVRSEEATRLKRLLAPIRIGIDVYGPAIRPSRREYLCK